MKILCLYNNLCAEELFQWLNDQGHETILCTEHFDTDWCLAEKFDLAVSYTYRYILKKDQITVLNGNVVNLHNSYLPWNRGADPNIWSMIDGTPRGVSLHYVDENLDKGSIIAQKFVIDNSDETFESSYKNLDRAAKELFKEAFRYYPFWQEMQKTPLGNGNYHSVKDGIEIKKKIISYDMKVCELVSGGVTLHNIIFSYEKAVAA